MMTPWEPDDITPEMLRLIADRDRASVDQVIAHAREGVRHGHVDWVESSRFVLDLASTFFEKSKAQQSDKYYMLASMLLAGHSAVFQSIVGDVLAEENDDDGGTEIA